MKIPCIKTFSFQLNYNFISITDNFKWMQLLQELIVTEITSLTFSLFVFIFTLLLLKQFLVWNYWNNKSLATITPFCHPISPWGIFPFFADIKSEVKNDLKYISRFQYCCEFSVLQLISGLNKQSSVIQYKKSSPTKYYDLTETLQRTKTIVRKNKLPQGKLLPRSYTK